MIIYLYTKSGSKHAIDSRSMSMCKDLVELGEDIFRDMDERVRDVESEIARQWNFRVYECDLNSEKRKLKKVSGKRLLKMLKEEDELKTIFLKYKLRA